MTNIVSKQPEYQMYSPKDAVNDPSYRQDVDKVMSSDISLLTTRTILIQVPDKNDHEYIHELIAKGADAIRFVLLNNNTNNGTAEHERQRSSSMEDPGGKTVDTPEELREFFKNIEGAYGEIIESLVKEVSEETRAEIDNIIYLGSYTSPIKGQWKGATDIKSKTSFFHIATTKTPLENLGVNEKILSNGKRDDDHSNIQIYTFGEVKALFQEGKRTGDSVYAKNSDLPSMGIGFAQQSKALKKVMKTIFPDHYKLVEEGALKKKSVHADQVLSHQSSRVDINMYGLLGKEELEHLMNTTFNDEKGVGSIDFWAAFPEMMEKSYKDLEYKCSEIGLQIFPLVKNSIEGLITTVSQPLPVSPEGREKLFRKYKRNLLLLMGGKSIDKDDDNSLQQSILGVLFKTFYAYYDSKIEKRYFEELPQEMLIFQTDFEELFDLPKEIEKDTKHGWFAFYKSTSEEFKDGFKQFLEQRNNKGYESYFDKYQINIDLPFGHISFDEYEGNTPVKPSHLHLLYAYALYFDAQKSEFEEKTEEEKKMWLVEKRDSLDKKLYSSLLIDGFEVVSAGKSHKTQSRAISKMLTKFDINLVDVKDILRARIVLNLSDGNIKSSLESVAEYIQKVMAPKGYKLQIKTSTDNMSQGERGYEIKLIGENASGVPVEIQIMDEVSYLRSESCENHHKVYEYVQLLEESYRVGLPISEHAVMQKIGSLAADPEVRKYYDETSKSIGIYDVSTAKEKIKERIYNSFFSCVDKKLHSIKQISSSRNTKLRAMNRGIENAFTSDVLGKIIHDMKELSVQADFTALLTEPSWKELVRCLNEGVLPEALRSYSREVIGLFILLFSKYSGIEMRKYYLFSDSSLEVDSFLQFLKRKTINKDEVTSDILKVYRSELSDIIQIYVPLVEDYQRSEFFQNLRSIQEKNVDRKDIEFDIAQSLSQMGVSLSDKGELTKEERNLLLQRRQEDRYFLYDNILYSYADLYKKFKYLDKEIQDDFINKIRSVLCRKMKQRMINQGNNPDRVSQFKLKKTVVRSLLLDQEISKEKFPDQKNVDILISVYCKVLELDENSIEITYE